MIRGFHPKHLCDTYLRSIELFNTVTYRTQVGWCDEIWGTHFLNVLFLISDTSFCLSGNYQHCKDSVEKQNV
jgi:hypothetical protein